MSIHIAAEKGQIADRVLLPGDPLRAKHIAENFLENPQCYNNIRGMLGFTGTYKGVRVSIQGTGMGMPSMGIYAHELMADYGVQKLVRVGTCGANSMDVHIRDIVIAQAASTTSAIPDHIFGAAVKFAPIGDFGLLEKAVAVSRAHNVTCHVGNVLSADRFYDDEIDNDKLVSFGILATDMETAELYLLAARFHRQALGLFTVSDHIVTGERVPAEERETNFNDMIKIGLEAVIQD